MEALIPYAITAAVGAVFTLMLHEGSHIVVAYMIGGTIDEFVPWPHRHQGRIYFARFSFDKKPPWSVRRWEPIAPLLKAAVLAPAWAAAAVWLWAPLWAFAAWEVIDALWWFRGFLLPDRYWLDANRWRTYYDRRHW